MWIKRLFVTIVFLGLAGGVSAFSQELFANGGAVLSDTQSGTETQPAGQLGARFWYSDLLQLQGNVTYQDRFSVEGALLLRPFVRSKGFDPYAFVGFGRYINGSGEGPRTVVPAGVGATYRLNPLFGINFEVSGRWTVNEGEGGLFDTAFGIMPAIGISYDLRHLGGGDPAVLVVEERRRQRRAERDAATLAEQEDLPEEEDTSDVFGYEVSSADVVVNDSTVLVPDGIFIMGLADEDPLSLQTTGFKRVTISSFSIDRYEVTNAEYRDFLASLPPQEREAMVPDSTAWEDMRSRFGWTEYFHGAAFDNYPVVAISYEQAERYCDSKGKRLPTEAEWEYVARAGGVGGVYSWNGLEPRDDRGRYLANYNPGRVGYAADGYAFTAPVDAFPPNEWGIYNMSGNVAEWCLDAYSTTYSVLSDFNPYHEDPEESRRVVRGGNWASDDFFIGVGVRDEQVMTEGTPYIGCRCASDISTLPVDLNRIGSSTPGSIDSTDVSNN